MTEKETASRYGPDARRSIFVRTYLATLSGTKAAREAGYANPMQAGAALLKDAKVRAMIDEAMKARADKLDITAERVLQELAAIGFADIRNYCRWNHSGVDLKDSDELTPEQSKAVHEVVHTYSDGGGQTKLKMHDKTKALIKIGEHLGMWNETPTVNINMPDYEEILRLNGIKPREKTND